MRIVSVVLCLMLVTGCGQKPASEETGALNTPTAVGVLASEVTPSTSLISPTATAPNATGEPSPEPTFTVPPQETIEEQALIPLDADLRAYVLTLADLPAGYMLRTGYFGSNEDIAAESDDPVQALRRLEGLGRVRGYWAEYAGTSMEHALGTAWFVGNTILCRDAESAGNYLSDIRQNLRDELKPVSGDTVGDESFARVEQDDDGGTYMVAFRTGNLITILYSGGAMPSVGDITGAALAIEARIRRTEVNVDTSLPETEMEEALATDEEEDAEEKPAASVTSEMAESMDARYSDYVCGNLSPALADGVPGEVAIVASRMNARSGWGSTTVELVVRNNTSHPISRLGLSAAAYTADGKLFATGGDQGFEPKYVGPGEIAMGYAYFDSAELPADIRIEYEIEWDQAQREEELGDLQVRDCELIDDRVLGMLENTGSETITGPISVELRCFDGDGNILGRRSDFTKKDEAGPGETVPYEVSLGGDTCPIYLVTASGYTW